MKFRYWVVAALVAFYVLKTPADAAGTAHQAIGVLGVAATQVIKFVTAL